MSSTTGIGRASAILASGTMVSRVLGFVRAALLSYVIGSRGFLPDAYNNATYVPNSIYAIIGGGLLTAVLVPQIIRASSGHDRGEAYVNKLVTLAVMVFAVVTVIVTVASPWLMPLFVTKPETLAIAITFAYWSLPQLFFLALYSVLGEVLNARALVRAVHVGSGAEQRRLHREPRPLHPAVRRGGLVPAARSRARRSCSPAARPSASPRRR